MKDVDYNKWTEYIEELLKKYGTKPSLVLDLGCGTGSFCIEMAKRNYEMIGIDISTDMLVCAKQKSLEINTDILYLNQDISKFELYGTVDAVVSLMDSINYITNKNDLKRTFKLVNNYLNPGGLFIFDINSPYKLKKILGNNTYHHVEDDIAYIWENSFNSNRNTCQFDLTFFVKEKDIFKRFDEIHYERAYTIKDIKKLAENAGLEICAVNGEFTFTSPKKNCERIFFILKKPKSL